MAAALMTASLGLAAQSPRHQEADRLAREGIALTDEGRFKEGIALLTKARNLRPSEFDYPLEIARALMRQGNHRKAEKFLHPLQFHQQQRDELYALLSECYVQMGRPKQAEEACLMGVQRFPQSGMLHHRLAGVLVRQERIAEAIAICERGIEAEPAHPECYALASSLLDKRGDALWAWWYGEMCLHLTEDPELRRSMSKLVLRASGRAIQGGWRPRMDDAFDKRVAETLEQCRMEGRDNFTRHADARRCVAEGLDGGNALLDFYLKVIPSGNLESYAAMLLKDADKDAFLQWLPSNMEAFDQFNGWFYWNRIKPDRPFTRNIIRKQ